MEKGKATHSSILAWRIPRVHGVPKIWTRLSDFQFQWTAAHQAPPSMGFSRQEYWSGVPSPSPMSITTYSIYGYLSDLQFGTILKSTVIDILLLVFKLHMCNSFWSQRMRKCQL